MKDELRERIARALWEEHYRKVGRLLKPYSECHPAYERDADAVIAAIGLTEQREQGCTVAFNDDEPALHWAPRRRYVTPWERIEEDGHGA